MGQSGFGMGQEKISFSPPELYLAQIAGRSQEQQHVSAVTECPAITRAMYIFRLEEASTELETSVGGEGHPGVWLDIGQDLLHVP